MSIAKRAVLSLLLTLPWGLVVSAQTKPTTEETTSAGELLTFTARPMKQSFNLGEEVVFRFRLKNLSSKPIFVSRYMAIGDFVTLELTGPDGRAVPWEGKIKSVGYSKDAFLMLDPGQEVSAKHTITLVKGVGFVIDKPGRYTARAEYALGPPEYFANLAPKDSIPQGTFKAPGTHFTVAAPKEAKP
jgi:hypothetical protein